MNLLNIVKHLLYLTQTEYGSENPSTTADEILTAERLFEVLKSINVSYFTELDHCSFQQEYIPPRTLSFTGDRTTEVVTRKKYNVTHSYTIQPVTSANGLLLDKFLLVLQEKENTLGKRVQKNLIIPPNVVVRASKSGKSNDENHHAFLNEVLRPFVGKKFLLFLDAWKTQADLTKFRAVFPHQGSQLLIFPEGSTGYIQPQDLSLFWSWRFIHEKIEHYTH
ncbi:unnamed protein product [Rotaria sp. Silwood1]|nr:unnamed protein product [Rotaria sp. Silwood1]